MFYRARAHVIVCYIFIWIISSLLSTAFNDLNFIEKLNFTQSTYNVSIPENSGGRVYALSRLRVGIDLSHLSNAQLDILNRDFQFKFRITDGDVDRQFKTEVQLVKDFIFLYVRTRTSRRNTDLNRESRGIYSLSVETVLRPKWELYKESKYELSIQNHETWRRKCVLNVVIVDINDLDPIFDTSYYEFEIKENHPKFRQVGKITATDGDEGRNGLITYQINRIQTLYSHESDSSRFGKRVNPIQDVISLYDISNPTKTFNQPFIIEPFTGIIMVSQPLKRYINEGEHSSDNLKVSFRIEVQASDQGSQINFPKKSRGLLLKKLKYDRRRGSRIKWKRDVTHGRSFNSKRGDQTTVVINIVKIPNILPKIEVVDQIHPIQQIFTEIRAFICIHLPLEDSHVEELSVIEGDPEGILRVYPIDREDGVVMSTSNVTCVSMQDEKTVLYSLQILKRTFFTNLKDDGNLLRKDLANVTIEVKLNIKSELLKSKIRINLSKDNGEASSKDCKTLARNTYEDIVAKRTQFNTSILSHQKIGVQVPENLPPATLILQLNATFISFRCFVNPVFTITSGDENLFQIDGTFGGLYLKKSLDAEHKTTHSLTISIKNFEEKSANFFAVKVEITVLDENDNTPYFVDPTRDGGARITASVKLKRRRMLAMNRRMSPSFKKKGLSTLTVFVDENEPANTKVVQVKARDNDVSVANSRLTYNLLISTDDEESVREDTFPFEIDPFTGLIKTTRVIDYDRGMRNCGRYENVIVRASDSGEPFNRQVDLDLTIGVRNVNDNRPVFLQTDCVVNVSVLGYVTNNSDDDHTMFVGLGKVMKIPPPIHVMTLQAVDLDPGDEVSYRLVKTNFNLGMHGDNSSTASAFEKCTSLDRMSGQVFLTCPLNWPMMGSKMKPESSSSKSHRGLFIEQHSVYVLNVTATDGQHFSDVTSVTINVNVLTWNGKSVKGGRKFHNMKRVWKRYHRKISKQIPAVSCKKMSSIASHHGMPYSGGFMSCNSSSSSQSYDNEDDVLLSDDIECGGFVNVHEPTFDRQNTVGNLHVLEDVAIGTVIWKPHVQDLDIGYNGRVWFSVAEMSTSSEYSKFSSTFRISLYSGHLLINQRVDRESQGFYVLNITAYDQGCPRFKSSSFLLNITIDDVNDNNPIVNKTFFHIEIPENVEIGTDVLTLSSSDPDLGRGGEFTFKLVESDMNKYVSIDAHSGVLKIVGPLDYESFHILDLFIEITDSDEKHPLSSLVAVKIDVTDVNDHIPQFKFQEGHIVKIEENVPIGSLVTHVEAHDMDVPEGCEITYQLIGEKLLPFKIDPENGLIFTSAMLNFEAVHYYNLTVVASDCEEKDRSTTESLIVLSSAVNIAVQVVDVNENFAPPKFVTDDMKQVIEAGVPENMPPDTIVTTLTAFDGLFNVRYYIGGGSGVSFFKIDPMTGRISTNVVLDYESSRHKNHYWLKVFAEDVDVAPLKSYPIFVHISVLDVNDNFPLCRRPIYRFNLPEGKYSQPFMVTSEVKAFDHDMFNSKQGYNFTYFMTDSSIERITVNETTGDILVQGEFDFEQMENKFVEFDIGVMDGNMPPYLNTTCRVVLEITDVNDHAPVFFPYSNVDIFVDNHTFLGESSFVHSTVDGGDKYFYTFGVSKMTDPNFRIAAYDLDSGMNGKVSYAIRTVDNDHVPHFVICNETGNVYQTKTVTDGSTFHLIVRAHDSSDFDPKFSEMHVTVNVLPVVTTDRSTVKDIDHTPLTLFIDPEIHSNGLSIFEFYTPETFLMLLNIEGSHTHKLLFKIESGDTDHIFVVHPNQGILVLAKSIKSVLPDSSSLSLAENRAFSLNISVTNSVGERAFISFPVFLVFLEIGEVHAFRFKNQFETADIPSSLAVGEDIFNCDVISLKNGQSSTSKLDFKYSIHNTQSMETSHFFEINQHTGVVSVANPLNDSSIQHGPCHVITLALHIVTHSNFETVTIPQDFMRLEICIEHLTINSNLHDPIFLNVPGTSLIQSKVSRFASVGTEVLEVYAHDADFNSVIEYSLEFNDPSDVYFSIDRELGIVVVSEDLWTAENKEFLVNVIATDNGKPFQRHSSLLLHILVSDHFELSNVKFNPLLKVHSYSVIVDESFGTHSRQWKMKPILKVEIGNAYSSVRFKLLTESDDTQFFVVGYTTGVLSLIKPLDYEIQNLHVLNLEVFDFYGRKSDHCVVHIHVRDINDNRPIVNEISYSVRLLESAVAGSFIMTRKDDSSKLKPFVIEAKDADSGLNGKLSYKLHGGSKNSTEKFFVHPSTGVVGLKDSLDFEVEQTHHFFVSVSDLGIDPSPLTSVSSVRVDVIVLNVNDCPPKFDNILDKDVVKVSASLPTYTDVELIRLSATDDDVDAELTFSIISATCNDENVTKLHFFSIDQQSGSVRFGHNYTSLTVQHECLIRVEVSDGSFHDTATIIISFNDLIHEGVYFYNYKSMYDSSQSNTAGGLSLYDSTSVEENKIESTVISVIQLKGVSLTDNVRYAILNCRNREFVIGVTSGVLRTSVNFGFDRESQDLYTLVVEATVLKSMRSGRQVKTSVRTLVEVNILDVNDNAPMFVNKPYKASISLDSHVKDDEILRVQAHDPDLDLNGRIYYQLMKGDGQLFRVGHASGRITLRKNMDGSIFSSDNNTSESADLFRNFDLIIVAYDGGRPQLRSECEINIRILKSNVPIFIEEKDVSVNISENIPLFTKITTIKAVKTTLVDDESNKQFNDRDLNDNLIYSILNNNDKFFIHHLTGAIKNFNYLDYEYQSQYVLEVRVTDMYNSSLFSASQLTINVLNVNDNPLHFENDSYTFKMFENCEVKCSLGFVKALDDDFNGQYAIFYLLHNPNSKVNNTFSVDHTSGRLYAKQLLDFEQTNFYSFQVSAIKQKISSNVIFDPSNINNTSSLSSLNVAVVDVNIAVENVNDNKPTFQYEKYSIKVEKSSMIRNEIKPVFRVQAFDLDGYFHSQLKYTLFPSNHQDCFKVAPLTIDSITGVISLSSLESQCFDGVEQIDFNCSVSDGVHLSTVPVHFQIINVDNSTDKSFHFDDNLENEININLLQMNYTKPAKTLIGIVAIEKFKHLPIQYSISYEAEPKNIFNINSTTGKIFFNSEEFVSKYPRKIHVHVKAKYERIVAISMITVNVFTNAKPVFELEKYKHSFTISNMKVNTDLFSVTAYQLDCIYFQIACDLHYSLSSTADLFTIDERSGTVSLKSDASRFIDRTIKFEVEVSFFDLILNQRQTSSTEVTVKIVSDEKLPNFKGHADKLFIVENTRVGEAVAQVSLSEVDFKYSSDQVISYDIVSTFSSQYFTIDSNSGVIRVSSILDRESEEYELMSSVYSNGIPIVVNAVVSPGSFSSQTTVDVVIVDENDNAPIFVKPCFEEVCKVFIEESVPIGFNVIQVKAFDKDLGKAGEFSYVLKNIECTSRKDDFNALNTKFKIDGKTGEITTRDQLDFEKDCESYKLTVSTDSLMSFSSSARENDSLTLYIHVENVNDIPMTFQMPSYTAVINSEHIQIDTILIDFDVSDEDNIHSSDIEVFNENLIYYIASGNEDGYFKINNEGQLSVRRHVKTAQQFEMIVNVTDSKFMASTTAFIEILESKIEKECKNSFQKFRFSFRLPEDVTTGYRLNISSCSSNHIMESSNLKLIGGEDKFKLDSSTLEILTSDSLDFEIQSFYDLKILDMQSMTVSAMIDVIITDIDDENLQWLTHENDKDESVIELWEDTALGYGVVQLLAFDKDNATSDIKYTLVVNDDSDYSCNHAFALDQNFNGLVRLVKSLDRESVSTCNLKSQATISKEQIEVSNERTFEIRILDINDNPPVFESTSYFATVPEDAKDGYNIARVFASSMDSGKNAEISYSILVNNEDNLISSVFEIDATSGVISVRDNKTLDYEKVKFHMLHIEAKDGGSPPLFGFTSVNISVIDVNDNTPKFDYTSIQHWLTVDEDAVIGMEITKLLATDADSPQFATIRYLVQSGDVNETFHLDETSGSLRLANPLDRESVERYILEIIATDKLTEEEEEAGDGKMSMDVGLNSSVVINIIVSDVNDNPPTILHETMFVASKDDTFFVPSDCDVGFVIYEFEVVDFDAPPNSGPFVTTLMQNDPTTISNNLNSFQQTSPRSSNQYWSNEHHLLGNGHNPSAVYNQQHPPLFRVVSSESTFRKGTSGELGKLIVTNVHRVHEGVMYDLVIRITDSGMPSSYTDKHISVFVVKPSRFPPLLHPLDLTLVLYSTDFSANNMSVPLGGVKVTDKDPYDLITYSMTSEEDNRKILSSTELFEVDGRTGGLHLPPSSLNFLDAGLYPLNITVSDLKFNTYGSVLISVVKVPTIDSFTLLRCGMVVMINDVPQNYNIIKDIVDFIHLGNVALSGKSTHSERLIVLAINEVYPKSKRSVSSGMKNYEVLFLAKDDSGGRSGRFSQWMEVDHLRYELATKLMWNALPFLHAWNFDWLNTDGDMDLISDKCFDTCLNSELCNRFITVSLHEWSVIDSVDDNLVQLRHIYPKFVASHKCSVIKYSEFSANGHDDMNNNHVTNSIWNFESNSFVVVDISDVNVEVSVQLSFQTVFNHVDLMFLSNGDGLRVLTIKIEDNARLVINVETFKSIVVNCDALKDSQRWHDLELRVYESYLFVEINSFCSKFVTLPSHLSFESLTFGGSSPSDSFSGCMKNVMVNDNLLQLNESSPMIEHSVNVKLANKCSSSVIPGGSIDVCAERSPCKNNATCETVDKDTSHSYSCTCSTDNFYGKHCEFDVRVCDVNPCLNEGICISRTDEENQSDFICKCRSGCSGTICQNCIHGLNDVPCDGVCSNGGTCTGSHKRQCSCPSGFTGKHCELDVDECGLSKRGVALDYPCLNGGTCINTHGSFRCLCSTDFQGSFCQQLVTWSDKNVKSRLVESRENRYHDASDDQMYSLIHVAGFISSLFLILPLVVLFVCYKKWIVKQKKKQHANQVCGTHRRIGYPSGTYHIHDEFNTFPMNEFHEQRKFNRKSSDMQRLTAHSRLRDAEENNTQVTCEWQSLPRQYVDVRSNNKRSRSRSILTGDDELEPLTPDLFNNSDELNLSSNSCGVRRDDDEEGSNCIYQDASHRLSYVSTFGRKSNAIKVSSMKPHQKLMSHMDYGEASTDLLVVSSAKRNPNFNNPIFGNGSTILNQSMALPTTSVIPRPVATIAPSVVVNRDNGERVDTTFSEVNVTQSDEAASSSLFPPPHSLGLTTFSSNMSNSFKKTFGPLVSQASPEDDQLDGDEMIPDDDARNTAKRTTSIVVDNDCISASSALRRKRLLNLISSGDTSTSIKSDKSRVAVSSNEESGHSQGENQPVYFWDSFDMKGMSGTRAGISKDCDSTDIYFMANEDDGVSDGDDDEILVPSNEHIINVLTPSPDALDSRKDVMATSSTLSTFLLSGTNAGQSSIDLPSMSIISRDNTLGRSTPSRAKLRTPRHPDLYASLTKGRHRTESSTSIYGDDEERVGDDEKRFSQQLDARSRVVLPPYFIQPLKASSESLSNEQS